MRKPYYLSGMQGNTILIVKAVLLEIKEKQNMKLEIFASVNIGRSPVQSTQNSCHRFVYAITNTL